MTEGTDERGNPDLAEVHRGLVAVVARLDLAIDDAPNAAAVRTLTGQIAEVNARLTAVQRQLMAHQTDGIRDAARDVASSLPGLELTLRDLDRVENVVEGVSSALALVNKAIDTALMAG